MRILGLFLNARHEQVAYDDILTAMRTRDQIDSTRDVAPLRAADDAIILDSDDWDADQVLDEVVNRSENKKRKSFRKLFTAMKEIVKNFRQSILKNILIIGIKFGGLILNICVQKIFPMNST